MFTKVLIANRGEIAVRTIRTLKAMGVGSVAVHTFEDRHSLHVTNADEAVALTGNGASETYLDTAQILAAAKQTGAQAIIPGYGFLSENPDFAEACEADGIAFIGPTPAQIRAMGDKATARETMREAGVPTVPGSDGVISEPEEARRVAEEIGFPIMIKATAGGGGKGMRIAPDRDTFPRLVASAQNEARAAFGDPGVYLERCIQKPRHVEFQVFGDEQGRIIHMGERE